ncbi:MULTISPECIES: hypothetical protein [unclassified Sphingomonas]|jgi:hypothetical protein|uniref:hypothetical protein n=1 Tax=unclassified Sphingomonas TaxID=196159 RepID=UPI00082DA38E|nr:MULTISPECIES: hypothetical protein [unclassified Sphingomonas]
MARRIIGTIIGILVFGLATTLVQLLGHMLYPPPPGVDMRNAAEVARIAASIPVPAKLIVLLAYLVGGAAGAFAALRLSRWSPSAWIVLALAWAGNVLNLMAIPHPLWMAVGSFIAPLIGVLLAQRLARTG